MYTSHVALNIKIHRQLYIILLCVFIVCQFMYKSNKIQTFKIRDQKSHDKLGYRENSCDRPAHLLLPDIQHPAHLLLPDVGYTAPSTPVIAGHSAPSTPVIGRHSAPSTPVIAECRMSCERYAISWHPM